MESEIKKVGVIFTSTFLFVRISTYNGADKKEVKINKKLDKYWKQLVSSNVKCVILISVNNKKYNING